MRTNEFDCVVIGGGHAEGFFESWANLYSRFGRVMDAKIRGKDLDIWYPDIEAGIAGLEFIEACVESDKNGSSWVEVG